MPALVFFFAKIYNVLVYSYTEDNRLNICRFSEMSETWLDFIVACRSGKEHDFDIVEGPIADDTIWDYIEDFTAGNISREAFWTLVEFKYPTHQIVFCTEEAVKTLLYFLCYMIERIARKIHQRNKYVVNKVPKEETVDTELVQQIPTATQMGKVYKRLILDTMQSTEDYVDGMIRVYNGDLCEILDNYNCGAYYEPSYFITRAYFNNGF